MSDEHKLIICIISCKKGAHLRQVIRETWLKNCPYDYCFVIGGERPNNAKADEVYFDCPDSYEGLVTKIAYTINYVLGGRYDYIFKCDHDSFINWRLISETNYYKFDYTGHLIKDFPDDWFFKKVAQEFRIKKTNNMPAPFAAGMGYFLSRKSMNFVANSLSTKWDGMMHFEDQEVGTILYQQGIMCREVVGVLIDDKEKLFSDRSIVFKRSNIFLMHHCTGFDMRLMDKKLLIIAYCKYFLVKYFSSVYEILKGQILNPHMPVKFKKYLMKSSTSRKD